MVKDGNWWVELDDGGGADRHCEIDGHVRLEVGEILQGKPYGRRWRIDRIDTDQMHAHAIPAD